MTSFHAKFVPTETDHNMITQNKITMETVVLENKKKATSISFRGPNANVVKLWQKQLILRQAVILSSLEREFFLFSKYIDIIFSRIHLLWTCNECQRRDYVVHRKYLIISIFSCGEQFQNHKISNMA